MSRHLLRKFWRFPQRIVKQFISSLLRALLLIRRPARLARSGFVLPTTALLVLMVLLTATALTYRAFTRSDQAITQREQQVIVNSATPAIDRAKAKIEFLFQSDPRFPSGVPASDILADLMANERQASIDDADSDWAGYTTQVPLLGDNDPFTLPDETRVNINGGSNDANADELDNAWMFRSDINGDGVVSNDEIIVYSILVDDVGPEDIDPDDNNAVALQEPDDQIKANALVTRTGPLATTQATASCGGAIAEGGWQIVQAGNNSTLQKNFQINVFVANTNEGNQTFESMEFQQSRVAARSSKWGAWFRYDLEIHPGPDFNWNGAMHTDGNLVLWGGFDGYLVSSPASCVYSQRSSEITLGQFDYDDNGLNIYVDSSDANSPPDFQGQIMAAKTDGDEWDGGSDMEMHIFDGLGNPPITNETINANGDNDSVIEGNSNPSDVAMDPLVLFAQDKATHIDTGTENNPLWERDPDWDDTSAGGNPFRQADQERVYNDLTSKPFVDDFFRADDRWGPKPRYEDDDAYDMTADNDGSNDFRTGVEIEGSGLDSTIEDQIVSPTEGLDGYWERQAISKGLRLVVGERLELGNPNGWGFDPRTDTFDPAQEALYPHTGDALDNTGIDTGIHGGAHERLHRKALHDNLAAVQSMAVYHYQGGGGSTMGTDGTFPLACYALTSHPGTEQSIINSRTFEDYENLTDVLKVDFFSGTGTNGWEFAYHEDFDTPAEFDDAVVAGQPLGDALRNLAYFAGDPDGGAPSFEPVQDDYIHPYPLMAMWGNFSDLRRIIDNGGLTSAADYNALSFADQTTVHTAACTLSLLAYNINNDVAQLEQAIEDAPSSINNVSQQLGGAVDDIINCLEESNAPPANNACNGTAQDIVPFLQARGDLSTDTDPVTLWNDTTTTVIDGTCPATGGQRDVAGFQVNCDTGEYLAEYTLDDWIELIYTPGVIPSLDTGDDDGDGIPNDEETIRDFVNQVNYFAALIRDRDMGFREGQSPRAAVAYDPSAGSYVVWDGTSTEEIGSLSDAVFNTKCDPNIFQDLAATGGGGQENNVSVALITCSEIDEYPIRFPSLFYLFPTVDHDHDGTDYYQQPDGDEYIDQPVEEYINNSDDPTTETSYVETANASAGENGPYTLVGSDYLTGVGEIAAVPKLADMSDWVIPHTTPATGTLDDPDATDQAFRIAINANVANVAFLDKGVFNGREMLNTRVLDIDLSELTTESPYSGADYWLSANLDNDARGVVYAFREDAVREDEIVRPKNSDATYTPDYCIQVNKTSGYIFRLERESECQMNADPDNAQDPPLTADLISLKPVDFVPDPERRPHGFRLRTSQTDADGDFEAIDFSGGDPSADDARIVGMTFVTDNSVYIMGNFNPHTDNPGGILNGNNLNTANVLEEFTEGLLGTDYSNFYTRSTLNTGNFANLTVDHWRPVEVLSDAITVLSRNFVDGAVEDTFTRNTPSSYTNQTGPEADTASGDWVHSALNEDGTPNTDSPVWIDRNGVFYYLDSGTPTAYYDATTLDEDGEWRDITEGKQLQDSTEDTYINATFVSGIIPKRGDQGYGGLHNFPRFIQNWNSDLFIQGSFIQLNFSTASTGPFEQEGLEPGELPLSSEEIDYYDPPTRRWGYDVGLLYVPPAPAAERFVDIESPRSEYYREVAADDPFITNLRCAQGDPDGDGVDFIYPPAVRGTCPNDN